jgi:hypothetical protein
VTVVTGGGPQARRPAALADCMLYAARPIDIYMSAMLKSIRVLSQLVYKREGGDPHHNEYGLSIHALFLIFNTDTVLCVWIKR